MRAVPDQLCPVDALYACEGLCRGVAPRSWRLHPYRAGAAQKSRLSGYDGQDYGGDGVPDRAVDGPLSPAAFDDYEPRGGFDDAGRFVGVPVGGHVPEGTCPSLKVDAADGGEFLVGPPAAMRPADGKTQRELEYKENYHVM